VIGNKLKNPNHPDHPNQPKHLDEEVPDGEEPPVAGSVDTHVTDIGRAMSRYRLVWTSDANGAVSGNSLTISHGTIIACGFSPGSGGAQPTALYDVQIVCATHNADLLNEAGANLSNTSGEHRAVFMLNADKSAFARQWCHGGQYQLVVSGAGSTKSGTVDLYVSYQNL